MNADLFFLSLSLSLSSFVGEKWTTIIHAEGFKGTSNNKLFKYLFWRSAEVYLVHQEKIFLVEHVVYLVTYLCRIYWQLLYLMENIVPIGTYCTYWHILYLLAHIVPIDIYCTRRHILHLLTYIVSTRGIYYNTWHISYLSTYIDINCADLSKLGSFYNEFLLRNGLA